MLVYKPADDVLRWRMKPLVFGLSLLPLFYYAWGLTVDTLGANPVEAIIRASGDWALRFLLITLALTPLRRIIGWNWLVRFRRMLGLFAFFYASLHLSLYLWLDQLFDWSDIWADVVDRPFITVGAASMLILLLLALTSPQFMLRKMGRNWSRLHRTVYLAGGLSVLHFWWMKSSKVDVTEPLIYAGGLALLLGYRLGNSRWWKLLRAASPASLDRVNR